jgi:hypothetical protein
MPLVRQKSGLLLYGVATSVFLIGFFLLMKLLDLHQVFQLRYFNIVIIFIGNWLALRRLERITGDVGYLEGMIYTFGVTTIASFIFTIFIFLYLTFIDPAFLSFIKQTLPDGGQLDIWTLCGMLFSEGFASGVIISLILMQLYKRRKGLNG